DTEYEAAAYVAERPQLLKIANEMASYDGLDASDKEDRSVVLSQQVRCLLLYSKTQYKTHKMSLGSTTFQTFLKCLFFRTRHLTKGIIFKSIKLCFPSKKFSSKNTNVLRSAANAAYRSYREALRHGLEKVAKQYVEDFK